MEIAMKRVGGFAHPHFVLLDNPQKNRAIVNTIALISFVVIALDICLLDLFNFLSQKSPSDLENQEGMDACIRS